MIEGIAMLTVLAGMGIYFVKSTDLPKDLKDRSAQMQSEYRNFEATTSKRKFNFPSAAENKVEVKIETKKVATTSIIDNTLLEKKLLESKAAELLEAKKLERLAAIELQNKKIDELTLAITTLEQELKDNLDRNVEIQKQIDWHLTALDLLNRNKLS